MAWGVEAKRPHEGSARGGTGETPVPPVFSPFGKNLSLQPVAPNRTKYHLLPVYGSPGRPGRRGLGAGGAYGP